MIFVRIAPNRGSKVMARAVLDHLKDTVEKLPALLVEAGLICAQNVVLSTFAYEGASPITGAPVWHPLAERTIQERIQLHFPGEHPILYRTGSLLASLTAEGFAPMVIERNTVGRGWMVGRLGTRDPRFEWNQTGEDPGNPNLPKRMIWPEDDYERQFVAYTENILIHVVEGRPLGGP